MNRLLVKELRVYVYTDSTHTNLTEIFKKKEILSDIPFSGENLDIKDMKIIGIYDKLYHVYKKEEDIIDDEKVELFFVYPDIITFPQDFIEYHMIKNNSLPKTKEQWRELSEECDLSYIIEQ